MKKLLYLAYHLKNLDWKTLHKFSQKAALDSGKGRWFLVLQSIAASYSYLMTPLEFFQFHLYSAPKSEWNQWAGTSYMYEYQREMNPLSGRSVLSDKRIFLKEYASFVRHLFVGRGELEQDPQRALALIQASNKLVFKASDGQCGRGIEILDSAGMTPEQVMTTLDQGGNDMVEQFVEQHPDLQRLSPSGLNTLRIVTQVLEDGSAEILAARLRITINSSVDNMAAGNAAAEVNLETGKVVRAAVFSDITKEPIEVHPVTGTPIVGFEVPFFKESAAMALAAALHRPENRSVGWDIAITAAGPELIEGNHDWCKLLWQLPVNTGLKPQLDKFKKSKKS